MDAFSDYGMAGLSNFYLTDDHFSDTNMRELLQGVSDCQTAGHACSSSNINHDPIPGAHTTVTSPAQQAHIPDDSFWNTGNTMQLPNGMVISGSNNEIWTNFEELQPAMVGMWNAGQASMGAEAFAPPTSNHQYPARTPTNHQLCHNSPYASQAAMTPSLNYPTPDSNTQPSPVPVRRMVSNVVSKRKRTTTAVQPANLAPYHPSLDLKSAAAAREYLSRFDPSEAQLLDVPFDNVQTVQDNLHAYAARVHDALLAPYDVNTVTDDRQIKYLEQQEATLASLHKILSKPAQQKAAKASAILLVDAALAVHTNGVSAERFAKHTSAVDHNLKSDDAYKIATSLTCSARVDAMIDAVKANKLVAKDVLEGKNFLRFAECPGSYLARKLQYLKSNKTRQDKVDERLAEEEIKRGNGKKRARRADKEDNDDEFVL